MFREFSGNMDIKISHDLSRRMSVRKYDKYRYCDNDLYITSKIEMRQNNVREVQ